jgi:hypothetical protein
VKRLGREADHSLPSNAEVKESVELYLHSPNTPSWHGAQLKKSQGQLYLYLLLFLNAVICTTAECCVFNLIGGQIPTIVPL